MKKLVILGLSLIILLSGCQKEKTYTKYSNWFLGGFDTLTQYIAYTESEQDYVDQINYVKERLQYYNNLFDKYNEYEGINNICTINKNAGIAPVKVDPIIIDCLEKTIQWSKTISNKVNIALGPVLNIWHDYREMAGDGGVGEVPTLSKLQEANQYVSLDYIQIDKEASTVYISNKNASIDVGSTAKGYSVECIKDELVKMGVDNFLLSAGGNIAGHGYRKETLEKAALEACKTSYCASIESPRSGAYSDGSAIAMLEIENKSIVTSGDYERYYQDYEGVRYHHLIDPDTLFPAIYYRSVTIITEDSGYADFLSSVAFLTPFEECKQLIESLEGVEAVWLLENGKVYHSSGLVEGDNYHILNEERVGN